jgi:hypothetical protein
MKAYGEVEEERHVFLTSTLDALLLEKSPLLSTVQEAGCVPEPVSAL